VGNSTADPDRAREVTGTSAACSFLAPWLATGEVHVRFSFGAGCTAASSCLQSNNNVMDSLVALCFISDEFNLCLCGICGCENGCAHGQIFSTAQ
jgi:hypothetical protein